MHPPKKSWGSRSSNRRLPLAFELSVMNLFGGNIFTFPALTSVVVSTLLTSGLSHPSQRKQQELGDMMDLSSYLLRPIQRISKYSLLLQDILALAGSYRPKDMIQDTLHATSVCAQSVCGPVAYVPDLTNGEREREKAEIQAAAELVRFQMRHGNDLLTMDAIQDCDVRCE